MSSESTDNRVWDEGKSLKAFRDLLCFGGVDISFFHVHGGLSTQLVSHTLSMCWKASFQLPMCLAGQRLRSETGLTSGPAHHEWPALADRWGRLQHLEGWPPPQGLTAG